MTEQAAFWLAAGSLIVTCLAAVGAKALHDFSRHALAEFCIKRKSRGRLGEIIRYHERVAMSVETLQVIATAVAVSAASYWVWLSGADGVPPTTATLLAGIGVAGLLLLAAEIWLPWAIARLWAEPFLFYTWHVWRAVSIAFTPLMWCARFIDTLLHRLAGRTPEVQTEESFEEEIRTIVSEGHREGLLEEEAREMIEGVIELGDADVSEIMTPRTDMLCMPAGKTIREALHFVSQSGHSRIPVYGKNRDDIVGILYAKDLLHQLAKGSDPDQQQVDKVLRRPYFVPETKPVDSLLEEFQRTRNHMAVVLDEYGGVSGLVTIEDVLEEIVGEIVDEYDEALVDGFKEIDDRTTEVLARVHIDEINDRLGLKISDEGDFDTIGGFVFSALGHMPAVGESVVWENVRITVLEVTRRRIERVRIEILDEVSRESA